MSTPTILCRLDDISDGGAKRVVFDGQSFAVFRHGEEVYAISDRCSHQGGSLSNGFLDGNVVECPCTGRCLTFARRSIIVAGGAWRFVSSVRAL